MQKRLGVANDCYIVHTMFVFVWLLNEQNIVKSGSLDKD
jgi:hypothetical protein